MMVGMMVGRLFFLFGMAYFQGKQLVSRRVPSQEVVRGSNSHGSSPGMTRRVIKVIESSHQEKINQVGVEYRDGPDGRPMMAHET